MRGVIFCDCCGKVFGAHKNDFATHPSSKSCIDSRSKGFRFDTKNRDMMHRALQVPQQHCATFILRISPQSVRGAAGKVGCRHRHPRDTCGAVIAQTPTCAIPYSCCFDELSCPGAGCPCVARGCVHCGRPPSGSLRHPGGALRRADHQPHQPGSCPGHVDALAPRRRSKRRLQQLHLGQPGSIHTHRFWPSMSELMLFFGCAPGQYRGARAQLFVPDTH